MQYSVPITVPNYYQVTILLKTFKYLDDNWRMEVYHIDYLNFALYIKYRGECIEVIYLRPDFIDFVTKLDRLKKGIYEHSRS